jgi:hypothetical protein
MCVHGDLLIQRVVDKYDKSNFHAICFDGFLYNKLDSSINIQDLNKLTADYEIKWDTKPLSRAIMIPEDFKKPCGYLDYKKQFEENHAICLNPMCYIKSTQYGDLLMNKSDFSDAVAPWKKTQQDVKKPIFDFSQWLEDPCRRAYNKMVFEPYNDTDQSQDDVYNSFKPFTAKYIKQQDRHKETCLFRDHLTTNMCNNDEMAGEWLYNLFSWRFQNPNKLPEVGVVLKGLQGSGKDRTIDIMAKIMGNDNEYIHRTSEMNELYGNFNSALKNKLIVQCNEIEGRDGCEYKEKLKDTITRDSNTINEKNIKPYKLQNLGLLIVCSNNLTPINIPFDDRRWVVFGTGETNIGNRPYWKYFSSLIDDAHWIDSLYSDFMDTNLQFWKPSDLSRQPQTEAYLLSQEDSIPLVYKYLNEVDWDSQFMKHKNEYLVAVTDLEDNINSWCELVGYSNGYRIQSKQIIKLLREITGVQSSVRLRINGKRNRFSVFDKEKVVHHLKYRIFKNIVETPLENIIIPLTNDDQEEGFDPIENDDFYAPIPPF